MSNTVLNGLGTESLTIAGTSVGFASIPSGAHRAWVAITTADVNYENDGGAATTSDTLVRADGALDLTTHVHQLQNFRFIRNGSTSATATISYYD